MLYEIPKEELKEIDLNKKIEQKTQSVSLAVEKSDTEKVSSYKV